MSISIGSFLLSTELFGFIRYLNSKADGLVKSRFTDGFVKSSKFKARALTTTRRAGGLDFRPADEKTKARQCLQHYVCESKQSRVTRRTDRTPQ